MAPPLGCLDLLTVAVVYVKQDWRVVWITFEACAAQLSTGHRVFDHLNVTFEVRVNFS